MIDVLFRTNLDLECCEHWPRHLQAVPCVGDHIESSHKWGSCHLILEVVRITWRYTKSGLWREDGSVAPAGWYPEIEMHLPKGRFQNLTAFYEFYGKLTGKGHGAYI